MSPPLHEVLARRLRVARAERGWSQERLAEAAGLDRSYVGEIERGRVSASLATLDKLARACGCPAWELIRGFEAVHQNEKISG